MWPAAEQRGGVARPGVTMRPRRWYTDEVTPPRRQGVKLTARLWRYRALMRRKRNTTATQSGSPSPFRVTLKFRAKFGG